MLRKFFAKICKKISFIFESFAKIRKSNFRQNANDTVPVLLSTSILLTVPVPGYIFWA